MSQLHYFSLFLACLKELIVKCVPGAKAYDLCEFGDKYLDVETSKVFKKEKSMKKGKF